MKIFDTLAKLQEAPLRADSKQLVMTPDNMALLTSIRIFVKALVIG